MGWPVTPGPRRGRVWTEAELVPFTVGGFLLIVTLWFLAVMVAAVIES